MIITVKQIMEWGPCDEYSEDRVASLVGDGMTPRDILDLKIPLEDRLWVVARTDVVELKDLLRLARVCARIVLPIFEQSYPGDKRPRRALYAAAAAAGRDYAAKLEKVIKLYFLRN